MRIPMIAAVALALVACKGKDAGTDESTGLTDVWNGDPDLITTSVWPSKRSEILAGAHEATNSILIFGGNDGPIVNQIPSARFRNDTWVFEPGVGWAEVQSADAPRKRGRYALSVDDEGNRALLFGGRFRPEDELSGDYTLFNDLWEFDYLSRTWTQVHDGSGTAPPPRYYPASAYDPSTGLFYIWGGSTNTSALVIETADDLWAWDGTSWTEIETSGNPPSPRTFFGSTHDAGRNRIVLFGGQIGDFQSYAYNDTYALDLETHAWERLHNGDRGPAPSTRMHAMMGYDPTRDRVLLWGGHTDIGDLNDLWVMDPETGDWSEERIADELTDAGLGCLGNPSEVPSDFVIQDTTAPERRHRGMFAVMHDNVWIYGGIHSECSDQLDDTWRYDLGGTDWHQLIEATSGESCERRNDDCDCLCI